MSTVSRHWTLTPAEVRILIRPDVLEKYTGNPPEWYKATFSEDQRTIIRNVLENAGKIQNKDEKTVIGYMNRQVVWVREAFIVILEEEIKNGSPSEDIAVSAKGISS